MSLWISARSKPEYGNSGWRTSRKKIALWAFQPALRGGFNYTLLELEDVATVLRWQWQYTRCECVVHWWYSRLCLVLCALLISKLRYRDLLFDWSLLHTERSRCVIALSVGPPATPHWAFFFYRAHWSSPSNSTSRAQKNSFTKQNTPTLTHRHLRPSALGKLKLGKRSYVALILSLKKFQLERIRSTRSELCFGNPGVRCLSFA